MKKISWLVAALALALAFSACDLAVSTKFVDILAAPQGYVVDITTGNPVSGVSVKLKSLADSTESTATLTNTSGYYTFKDLKFGQYELTATKTGLVFVKQIVEVAGVSQTLPQIGGFAYDATNADDPYRLRITTLWNADFADVDARITFPTTLTGTAPTLSKADWYNLNTGTAPTGFFPNATTNRTKVTLPTESTTDVKKDVDNYGDINNTTKPQQAGGPETITFDYIPAGLTMTGTSYTAVADDVSGLTAGTYTWQGVAQYYLHAWDDSFPTTAGTYNSQDVAAKLKAASNSGDADPVTYVFYGDKQLARITLPDYQNFRTASVVRINMFKDSTGGEWYQILADVRNLADGASIRSTDGSNAAVIATVGGRKR